MKAYVVDVPGGPFCASEVPTSHSLRAVRCSREFLPAG